jgi:hypothetical protein
MQRAAIGGQSNLIVRPLFQSQPASFAISPEAVTAMPIRP